MSYNLTSLDTGLTPDRLGNIMAYSFFVHEHSGAFAEFGVFKGGSLELLAMMHPERKIYGIDGFKGLPKPSTEDVHVEGDFALSEYEFGHMKNWFEYNHKNVEIVRGYSPKVFDNIPKDETFSFVHVDVDLYNSVNDALDYFYPRLIEGGIMIFDDYGFNTTPGAKKAIDQWDKSCAYRGELIFFQNIFCGQYLIRK